MNRPKMRSLSIVIIFAAALVACGTITGMAASSTPVSALPGPEELPAHTVAVVTHVPMESRTVTVKELDRAIVQVVAQSGLKSTPSPKSPRYERLEEEAFGDLLEGLWIQGQAAEMGIVATDRQVTIEFAQIEEESFETKRQFHSYLKRSHLTMRDARYRVELQLLSKQIQARVINSATSRKDLRNKLAAFLSAYQERWRSRTVCAAQYATERCSNGPTPESELMP